MATKTCQLFIEEVLQLDVVDRTSFNCNQCATELIHHKRKLKALDPEEKCILFIEDLADNLFLVNEHTGRCLVCALLIITHSRRPPLGDNFNPSTLNIQHYGGNRMNSDYLASCPLSSQHLSNRPVLSQYQLYSNSIMRFQQSDPSSLQTPICAPLESHLRHSSASPAALSNPSGSTVTDSGNNDLVVPVPCTALRRSSEPPRAPNAFPSNSSDISSLTMRSVSVLPPSAALSNIKQITHDYKLYSKSIWFPNPNSVVINRRKNKEGKDPFAPFDDIISQVILADGVLSGSPGTSRVKVGNRNQEKIALICVNRKSLNCRFKCNAKRVTIDDVDVARITTVDLFHKCSSADNVQDTGTNCQPISRKRVPKMISSVYRSATLSAFASKTKDLSSNNGGVSAIQLCEMVKKENPALIFSPSQARRFIKSFSKDTCK